MEANKEATSKGSACFSALLFRYKYFCLLKYYLNFLSCFKMDYALKVLAHADVLWDIF